MDNKKFKNLFSKVAINNDFIYKYTFWYKESSECVLLVDLQKSNYMNAFYINIKIFIQGVFEKKYLIDTDLKKDTGDIFRRTPSEYDVCLNLENGLLEKELEKELEKLFINFINPFSEKALTIKGIYELKDKEEISILPTIYKELEKLKKI